MSKKEVVCLDGVFAIVTLHIIAFFNLRTLDNTQE